MTWKRNREPPPLSFQERLTRFARDTFAAAKKRPAGARRQDLVLEARDEAAAELDRWLSSPGLQSPK